MDWPALRLAQVQAPGRGGTPSALAWLTGGAGFFCGERLHRGLRHGIGLRRGKRQACRGLGLAPIGGGLLHAWGRWLGLLVSALGGFTWFGLWRGGRGAWAWRAWLAALCWLLRGLLRLPGAVQQHQRRHLPHMLRRDGIAALPRRQRTRGAQHDEIGTQAIDVGAYALACDCIVHGIAPGQLRCIGAACAGLLYALRQLGLLGRMGL